MKYNYLKVNSVICLITILILTACSKGGSNPTPSNSTPALAINSIDVNTGGYNTKVTISGSAFSQAANDQVFFNGVAATVELATPTEIIADVPLGAGTGNVTITVNGTKATGPVFTYQQGLVVTTLAGSLSAGGFANGTGGAATFDNLAGLAIDKDGNLYAADQSNFVIRKITPKGVVTTFAGSGKQGRADGTVLTATFEDPTGVAVDQSGNVFVADGGILREITANGNVSTITTQLSTGGGTLNITGVAVDAAANLYIADPGDHLVGKVATDGTVTAISGTITTMPDGTEILNFSQNPQSIALDKSGNLFITDGIVWKVTPPNIFSKFATTGFSNPQGIAVDSQGNLYVADDGNMEIRKITAAGQVSLLAGISGVGVPADGVISKAAFRFPTGIVVDASGNIFVTDVNAIREITFQ